MIEKVGYKEEQMTPREMGIGIVGYGAMGRTHALCFRMLPLVYPDLPVVPRIVAVTTSNATTAERAGRELGVAAKPDLDALLAQPGLDLVDCCTPTGDHLRVATAALNAHKALFCEKPLAANAAEARQIAVLARERGLPGGINFHFRGAPAIQEASSRVAAGLLGEVLSFHLTYYHSSNLRNRPLTWRFAGPGSGVLLDLGSHLVDLMLYLLGPTARVAARLRTIVPERAGPDGQPVRIESDDMVQMQVELASGASGTLEASKVVPGAGDDLRFEAYGTQGALLFDTREPNGLYVVEGAGAPAGWQRVATLSQSRPPATIFGPNRPTGAIQWYVALFADFFLALAKQERPRPDLEDGARVQDVLDAAFASADAGGKWVEVTSDKV
jgi:predicted dehydrogenase